MSAPLTLAEVRESEERAELAVEPLTNGAIGVLQAFRRSWQPGRWRRGLTNAEEAALDMLAMAHRKNSGQLVSAARTDIPKLCATIEWLAERLASMVNCADCAAECDACDACDKVRAWLRGDA